MFIFKGCTGIYSEGKRSILITIDSLITTSTISFVAFTNYASSSSGSSQVIRKLSWASLRATQIQNRKKWTFLKEMLFPATVIPLLLSIFVTLFDVVLVGFISNETLVILYLYSNVVASSLIMVLLIVKYIIFNKDSYQFSANALAYHFSYLINLSSKRIKLFECFKAKLDSKGKLFKYFDDKITKLNRISFLKTRIYCRNHLNPIKSSKNETLIRTISRQINDLSKKNLENWKLIFSKIKNEIILDKQRNVYTSFSLMITLYWSNKKLAGKKFKNFYETFILSVPWHENYIWDQENINKKNDKPYEKESFVETTEKMRLDHNEYVKDRFRQN